MSDASGDMLSFESVFNANAPKMVSFAQRYVSENAEDIVQTVFLNLWRIFDDIPSNTDFGKLLYTMTKNECLSFLRHTVCKNRYNELQRRRMLSAIEYSTINSLEITQQEIDAAIEQLPPHIRTVFVMNRFDGLTYSQIASTLSLSEKTIEKRMGQALKILRNVLDETKFILLLLQL